MSNTPSLPRRLAVLTAGLATCLTGQVVTAPEPRAAPSAAPTSASVAVPAAARTPDRYTPKPGALFNKPTGTRAQQYRPPTHLTHPSIQRQTASS